VEWENELLLKTLFPAGFLYETRILCDSLVLFTFPVPEKGGCFLYLGTSSSDSGGLLMVVCV